MNCYDEIYKFITQLEIIDTHEHLPPRECMRNQNGDLFTEYLTHYFSRDLLTAGMPPADFMRLFDQNLSITERWRIVEPWWDGCRHTGYGQVLDFACKDLHGLNGINSGTVEALDESIRRSLTEPYYHRVLKEECHIKTALLCHPDAPQADREYFTPVGSLDHIVRFHNMQILIDLQTQTGIPITGFDSWLDACEAIIDHTVSLYSIIKCGLAYNRDLYFPRALREDAERSFTHALNQDYNIDKGMRHMPLSEDFENYMMHFLLARLNKKNCVLQIHTGLHEGNGNLMNNSNPEHLNNLFLDYPDIRFDIFHIGYPYQHVLSGLAKNFPNVYLNMCWAHAISPVASMRALSEWLETVPYKKILAFGGDYMLVDGTYGHQKLARMNVAKVLARKIEEGLFTTDRANEIASSLFYKNPAALYGIS